MKNVFKRLTVVIILIGILVSANISGATAATQQQFKDVKSTDWYYNDVMKLAELNLTSGAGNGMYKPQGTVTRAEFVTFMCRVIGLQPSQNNSFIDTKKHWADGYITISLANNIINLPIDRTFRPNDAITRQEAVEIMCRTLNIQQDNLFKTPYVDVKSNAGYINAAYSNYLMQGSIVKDQRYFYPQNKLTRGEVARVVVNAYDYHTDKMVFLNKAIAAEKKRLEEESKAKEPTYATADKDFEAFMNNKDEARKYCSIYNIDRVENGKIYWNTYKDGVKLLTTDVNKDSNKEAYELVKTLISYARKYNHWVEIYYCYGDDDDVLQIFYTTDQHAGLMGKARINYNLSLLMRLGNKENIKIFGDPQDANVQKKPTDYNWRINGLYDGTIMLDHDRSVAETKEKCVTEPLYAALNVIYKDKKLTDYIYNYMIKLHDARVVNDYNYFISFKEVTYPKQFPGLEIQAKMDLIGTNKNN